MCFAAPTGLEVCSNDIEIVTEELQRIIFSSQGGTISQLNS